MKTYKIELRHAPSKNRLNDFRDNRLPPLTVPLILFIFPCLLGVLILPAAIRVGQVFGHP